MIEQSYCAYVAIVGRPNVGKSTLMNHLLGKKLSITSRKPQTTRHQLLGILTEGNRQVIFVDTPGIHEDHQKKLINKMMNRAAWFAVADVDIILMMLDARGVTSADHEIISKVVKNNKPCVLLLNKSDLVDQDTLLPMVRDLNKRYPETEIIPISALKEKKLDVVKQKLLDSLHESPKLFPDNMVTDRDTAFMITEFIREKVFRVLGQELPYASAVVLEEFKQEEKITKISALILVERDGQKKIIIGKGGSKLKQIGTDARRDIEHYLEQKVHLQLWVKVKRGWSDEEKQLQELGL